MTRLWESNLCIPNRGAVLCSMLKSIGTKKSTHQGQQVDPISRAESIDPEIGVQNSLKCTS